MFCLFHKSCIVCRAQHASYAVDLASESMLSDIVRLAYNIFVCIEVVEHFSCVIHWHIFVWGAEKKEKKISNVTGNSVDRIISRKWTDVSHFPFVLALDPCDTWKTMHIYNIEYSVFSFLFIIADMAPLNIICWWSAIETNSITGNVVWINSSSVIFYKKLSSKLMFRCYETERNGKCSYCSFS